MQRVAPALKVDASSSHVCFYQFRCKIRPLMQNPTNHRKIWIYAEWNWSCGIKLGKQFKLSNTRKMEQWVFAGCNSLHQCWKCPTFKTLKTQAGQWGRKWRRKELTQKKYCNPPSHCSLWSFLFTCFSQYFNTCWLTTAYRAKYK